MRKVSVENEAFKSDIAKLRQQIATTEQKMANAVNEAKREGEQKVSYALSTLPCKMVGHLRLFTRKVGQSWLFSNYYH